jgi:hypothetical protein
MSDKLDARLEAAARAVETMLDSGAPAGEICPGCLRIARAAVEAADAADPMRNPVVPTRTNDTGICGGDLPFEYGRFMGNIVRNSARMHAAEGPPRGLPTENTDDRQ